MQYYVRAGALAGFIPLVHQLGGDPCALMQQCGLNPADCSDPDSQINYQTLAELLENSARQLKEPRFGLHLGLRQGLSTLGLIGSYMAQQDSLLKALQIAGRYNAIHAQGVSLQQQPQADKTRVALTLELAVNRDENYPQLAQLSLMLVYQMIVQLLPDCHGPEIQLRQPAPLQAGPHQPQLPPVRYRQQHNAVCLPRALLMSAPRPKENLNTEITARQFGHNGDPAQVATEDTVQHAIRMLLPTGQCSKDNVARILGLHSKTLERQLKARGYRFRSLLEATRKEAACHALENSRISLSQLALALGYSEFSAFSRGFKHWFGVSPRHYRRPDKTQ